MTFDRRLHQKLAIADILAGYQRNDRGQFISACGTGKTVTCLWVKEDLDARRTLVLVPSLALVDQVALEWRKHHAPEMRYATLCVCSDVTVGRMDDQDYDHIDLTPEDLKRDGLDVTSDPSRIAEFLRQDDRQVIFCTYQSSHLVQSAQADESVPSLDLAIADEAHRCAGDKNSLFAIILDEDRIRTKRRLFATATPRIHGLKRGQEKMSTELVDMSDETKFGPVFHSLTMGKAIAQDLLSDYRVAIMAINDSDIQLDADDKNKARQAVQVGVLKAIREYDLSRVISFHCFVKNAAEFAHALPSVAAAMWPEDQKPIRLVADFVSGSMTAQVRKQKMTAFRSVEVGQCSILSNARCLTEGVDVPDIDGIAFIDPRDSMIEIVQALGRAIRKHEGKTHGTIILPVFMGHGQTPQEALENSDFKTVYDVLNALRAHDADFEAALNERRQVVGGAPPSDADPFTRIKIIGTEHVAELTKAIQLQIVEELTDDWEVWFGAAKAWQEKYSDCNAPIHATWPEHNENGLKLGKWLRNQRVVYHGKKQGVLPMERIRRLESLGMIWNPRDAAWEEGFACMRDYRAVHGHCNVPIYATWPEGTPDGFTLGDWLKTQRRKIKQGGLSAERIQKLESLGLGMASDHLESAWEKSFSFARAYFDVHGHSDISQSTTWPENDPNGYKLGRWVGMQRVAYKTGGLSADQVMQLESIGMKWIPLNAAWEEGFACMRDYRAVHGDANVPIFATWPENDSKGFKLGSWVFRQRQMFKADKLSPERIEKLESLNMIWDPREAAWEEGFACALDYCAAHGDCNAPRNAIWPENASNGFLLGNWMHMQRQMFKAGKMSPERIQRLESIGMMWSIKPHTKPVDSRILLTSGRHDEALELLEEAPDESLEMRI